MRHFQAFTYPEEQGWPLPGPLESLGMEKPEKRLQWRRLDVGSLVARRPKRKSWFTLEGNHEIRSN